MQKIRIFFLSIVTYCLMRFLGFTSRLVHEEGKEHLLELIRADRPTIFSFWHNTLFWVSYYHYRFIVKAGVYINVLASQSGDGAIIAGAAEMLGTGTVRGSTSKGGRQALRQLMINMTQKSQSTIITPDGPRGPIYQVQPGIILLARTAKAPVLPFGFAADRYWAMKSWDGFQVPKPFARIALVIGEKLEFDDPKESAEEARQRVETALLDVRDRAREALKKAMEK